MDHGKTEFSIFSVVFESQIPNTAINGLHTVYNVYIVLIVHTVCTNHTAQTALHCLKSSSMFAFTYFKVVINASFGHATLGAYVPLQVFD